MASFLIDEVIFAAGLTPPNRRWHI